MAQPQAQRQQTQPMDQLQALLNVVLLQVGQVMGDPNKRRDPNTRMALTVIPKATHRFHEALDKLEDELTRARAVIRRDLAILQAERERREREEAEAKKNAVNASMNGTTQQGDREGDWTTPDPQRAAVVDTTMKDELTTIADASTAVTEAPGVPVAPMQAVDSTAPLPAPNDGIFDVDGAASAMQGEFDIDSMFTFNEDLGDAAQAMGGGEDLTNLDVNTLLPGLESYASMAEGTNADDTNGTGGAALEHAGELDFNMLDLPATEQQPTEGQSNQQMQQQTTDSGVNNADVNLDFDLSNLANGDAAEAGGGGSGQDTMFNDLFNDLDNFTYEGNADGTTEGNGNTEDMFAFFN